MKAQDVYADLRQLCCLGLGGAVIMPAFLNRLRSLVGSNSSSFLWVEPPRTPQGKFKPSGLYTDLPVCWEIVAPQYLGKYCDTALERESALSFSEVLRSRVVDDMARHDIKARQRTGMDEEVFRPMDAYHGIRAPVYQRDETYGMLYLFRSEREPGFSVRDHERLTRILPFLAHAMHQPAMNDEQEFTPAGASGLLILDEHGRLLHSSSQARHLLFLAGEGRTSGSLTSRLRSHTVPPELVGLRRRLRGIFSNQDMRPPVFHVRTLRGQFVFRAYFLDGAPDNAGRALIGVTVEHQIPVKLKRWNQISALPLSAKQKEAALLLAEGATQPQIAERMSVRLSTAIDYVREIYAKLNVHSRAELLACMDSGSRTIL